MSDNQSGGSDQEWSGLAEDFNLISRAADRGIYKAIRHGDLGYEHLREDAIEEMEAIRNMADETLERYQDTES